MVKYVFPELSYLAPDALHPAQVLLNFPRPLCCAGNADCSASFNITFSLDTEEEKRRGGVHLLFHSKWLNLAGP